MPVASVALKQVALARIRRADGDAGRPAARPTRRASTPCWRAAARSSLDAFVVYGDREHAANVAYLSGYDPRFEETLLILLPGQHAAAAGRQ